MDEADDCETGAMGVVCLRCGTGNDERASRCAGCRAPLDDFASTAPWEMGTAESSAYRPVASPRAKPVIFWGAWLYFGPSVAAALWLVVDALLSLLGRGSPVPVVDGVLIALLMSGYAALGAWALWSVTKGYFGVRPVD